MVKVVDFITKEVIEFKTLVQFRNYNNKTLLGKPIRIECSKSGQDFYDLAVRIGRKFNAPFETSWGDVILKKSRNYTITVFPDDYVAEKEITFISEDGSKTTFTSIKDAIDNQEIFINKSVVLVGENTHDHYFDYSKKGYKGPIIITELESDLERENNYIRFHIKVDSKYYFSSGSIPIILGQHEPLKLNFQLVNEDYPRFDWTNFKWGE